MRTFRENGLNVTRAEISTVGNMAINIFYVTDAVGNPADSKIIESVRQKIGLSNLEVKELPLINHQMVQREDQAVGIGGAVLLSIGSLVRRNLYNLGLIKSCSWVRLKHSNLGVRFFMNLFVAYYSLLQVWVVCRKSWKVEIGDSGCLVGWELGWVW